MDKLTKIEAIEKIKDELSKTDGKVKKTRTGRFVVSTLSSIPWVGGVIAASSALHVEKEQGKINDL